jgi:hypothetical protein
MLTALWSLTAFALALWSLSAWGLHSLLTIDPAWMDDVDVLIAQMPYASTIDLWFPGWQELMRLSVGLTQSLLVAAGSAAPWAVWIVWGIGTAILLLLAGGLALLLKVVRRKPPTPPRHGASARTGGA